MLNNNFFNRVDKTNQHITRVDFYPSDGTGFDLLAKEFAEHLKKHRLHPEEILQWTEYILRNEELPESFKKKLTLVFSEGILKDNLSTIDDDAFTGTCGQLIFYWLREAFYAPEIIWKSPRRITSSSKEQGIDYFELLGDPNDFDSLSFIVWEVKATDGEVSSRTSEIYRMLKNRAPRLIRGLESQLSLDYPEEQHPVLGKFVRHLLDYWLSNEKCKKVGGAVIFSGNTIPQNVFTNFHNRFPNLASEKSRQVILINIPEFADMRRELWKIIQSQMS